MRVRAAVLLGLVLAIMAGTGPGAVLAEDAVITVTSAGDEPGATCPSATACTFRAALAVAEADTSDDPVVIAFDMAVFPVAGATTVVLQAPIPAITRANLRVVTGGRTIVISGEGLAADASGLIFEGSGTVVDGLAIHSFPGTCLELGGAASSARDVTIGGCSTGLRLGGAGAIVVASRIGFAPDGTAAPVGVGIVIAAGDTRVGAATPPPGNASRNLVGNADIGILVGDGGDEPVTPTLIGFTIFGQGPGGEPAPAGTGIRLAQPSSNTLVYANVFANISGAAIEVVASNETGHVDGNTFERNEFHGDGLAIDLGADGIRNPNGPPGPGPNAGVHHPLITRATQARVAGTACPGCRVELYATEHLPGDPLTQGTGPLPVAILTANGAGEWLIDAPPVAPGNWIAAIATDPAGNTSEFGPAARVGAGAIQCGNVSLLRGWNHSGYFGLQPLLLGDVVPGDPNRRIRAIYQLVDGGYLAWFRDTAIGRTLTSLEPGSAYWFLTDAPVTLSDGFTLTDPIIVPLAAGWNHFVYFGAADDVRDAFASIAPGLGRAYRWIPGDAAHWELFDPGLPHWSNNLKQVPACASYAVEMAAPGTLTPLQP